MLDVNFLEGVALEGPARCSVNRISKAASEMQARYPKEWDIVYPRVYKDVGDYHSPRELATDLLGALLISLERVDGNLKMLGLPDQQALIAATLLTSLKVPTFFVARNLLEAIAQTRPSEPIAWKEMHLPFEAAAFIFPRGVLKHTRDGECGFLWYARLRSGTIYRHPFFTKWTLEVEEDKLFFRAGLDQSLDSLMHGFTESRAPTIRAVDLGGRDTIYRGLTTERLNLGDQSLLQSAISLTVGVLLVMLGRPQMVAHGSFTGKRAKSGAEFWAPNIVGKTYRVESDLPHRDGHGVSPRMHWRRGHWRAQSYGERHLLRKLIWIEPTLVAGQSANEQPALSA